jgi:hypothetical protein
MMRTVPAIISARKTERYACDPRALNASSGPYAEEDNPSAPRPTQARKAARETAWKIRGSMGSRAFPTRIVFIVLGKVCPVRGRGGIMFLGWEDVKRAAVGCGSVLRGGGPPVTARCSATRGSRL